MQVCLHQLLLPSHGGGRQVACHGFRRVAWHLRTFANAVARTAARSGEIVKYTNQKATVLLENSGGTIHVMKPSIEAIAHAAKGQQAMSCAGETRAAKPQAWRRELSGSPRSAIMETEVRMDAVAAHKERRRRRKSPLHLTPGEHRRPARASARHADGQADDEGESAGLPPRRRCREGTCGARAVEGRLVGRWWRPRRR